jgi:hypothetical protein
MQYSQGNPAPTLNQLEFDELVHTVRRLAHHPSLAVYDGCKYVNARAPPPPPPFPRPRRAR